MGIGNFREIRNCIRYDIDYFVSIDLTILNSYAPSIEPQKNIIKSKKNLSLQMSSSDNYNYNSKCDVQYCSQGCCNYYGRCPQAYGSSYRASCYYYYNEQVGLSLGELVGAIVGGAVGLLLILVGIICCVKRAREQSMREMQMQIAQQQQNHTLKLINVNGGEGMGSNQVLFTNQQQPMYGQPIYSQPSVQDPMVRQHIDMPVPSQGYGQGAQVYLGIQGSPYGAGPILK